MTPRDCAKKYMTEGRVMQLGTLHDGHPRVNSVYFVVAPDLKTVYWISEPRRRHSQDIEVDQRASGAIVAQSDQPVAGLQFVGKASKVGDLTEVKESAQLYSNKYDGLGGQLYDRLVAGKNKNELYKLEVDSMELFDDANFPGDEVVTVPLG